MVQDMIEKVLLIPKKMKVAQDQQKSYADLHRRHIEFQFIGPYEILDRVGEIAYRLALPPALDLVDNVFHVSQLWKYISDPSHVLEVEIIDLDEALIYVEVPKEILSCKVRKTRNGETTLLKVLWSNHNVEEATWELEEAMKERYPHLFD
ncbi:uncharacterized protein LOC141614246 [Silene latifolia]|uniref:uncharacterized protein LOC141614246 n=1 Tax=Silene latifolia TaxID=37657 RepID=UPI003D778A63